MTTEQFQLEQRARLVKLSADTLRTIENAARSDPSMNGATYLERRDRVAHMVSLYCAFVTEPKK